MATWTGASLAGMFNTSPPTLTSGQATQLQTDNTGHLILGPSSLAIGAVTQSGSWTVTVGSAPALAAGTNLIGSIKLTDGTTTVGVNADTGLNVHIVNAVAITGTVGTTQSGSWTVGLTGAVPAGSNLIGGVKLIDAAGTNAASIDSNGNLKIGQELLTSAGAITSSTSQTLNFNGVSCGSWVITVAGIYSASGVFFEGTNDGSSWFKIYGVQVDAATNTSEPLPGAFTQAGATTVGTWAGQTGACTQIRARVASYVSGTVNIVISAAASNNLPNAIQVVGISKNQNSVSISPAALVASSGSITTAGSTSSVITSGYSTFAIAIGGTWTGTLTVSDNGSLHEVNCYMITAAGAYQYNQPFTTNGVIYGSCAALPLVQLKLVTLTSGGPLTWTSEVSLVGDPTVSLVGKGTYTSNPLSVQLTDGTDTALVNTDGSLNINVDPANNGTSLVNPIYTAPAVPPDGSAYVYNTASRGLASFGREVLVNINSSPIDTINGIDRTREYSTIVGSATITNSGGSDGTYKLHTTAATTDTITLESNVRSISTAAAGTETGITLNLMDGALPTHGYVLFGAWDGTDGAYFIIDQTNLGVVTMKSTTQSSIVRPASFNVDPLDGTGPSGMVWNAAHAYTYAVRIYGDVYQTIEWYVTGAKTSSSNTYVTALVHRMIATTSTTIVGALNLPVRVFMTNNANATSWNLKLGTRYIHTLGAHEPMTRNSSHVRLGVAMGNNTTYLPLVSFRKKSSNLIHTRVFVDKVTLIPSVAMIWSIFVNPTLTGASFVAPFNSAANDSSLEFDISATAYTLTNAWCIHNDIVPAAATQFIQDILATYPAGTIVSLGTRLVTAAAGTTVSAMLEAREEW